MAAVLTDIAFQTLDAFLNVPTLSIIGGITVDTTLEEHYEDTLEITEHPVQVNAVIADHSFKRPMELRLRCGWSDSNFTQLQNLFATAVNNSALSVPELPFGTFTGGAMRASDYVANIYSQLLALQESRQTIQVTSGLRVYDSMLITSLSVTRDQRSRFTLLVEADLRQIILVDTQITILPSQANQATPASTAETVNAGGQQVKAATPSSGGFFPPSVWSQIIDNLYPDD